MSGVLKKIAKVVKKTFKKIIKVIKKVLKSKIFKVVVIAAAVVFTGGAALGALGATGAATAGMAAAAPVAGMGTVAAGVGSAAQVAAAGAGALAAPASTGLLATLGSAVGTASTWAAANPMLASTALNMGGSMLSGMAAEKEAKEERKRRERELERNNSTELNIKEDTYGILDRTGYDYAGKVSSTGVQNDASGVSNYGQPSVMQSVASRPQNVENSKPKYFNASSNKWQQVGG